MEGATIEKLVLSIGNMNHIMDTPGGLITGSGVSEGGRTAVTSGASCFLSTGVGDVYLTSDSIG